MKKIAIISTRLGGIDGVSIEAGKWANAYSKIGLDPVYIAGRFDDEDKSAFFEIEEMDYYFSSVAEIRKTAFNEEKKATKNDLGKLLDNIGEVKEIIKKKLLEVLNNNEIKYLSIENALTIPLNIPLAIALTEVISENNIKAITRHHDFYWERKQFLDSNIEKMIDDYFPPVLADLKHIVINTSARKSIYDKKRIEAEYIPNIFDFDLLEKTGKKHSKVKSFLDMQQEDLLVLQPTRLIARKNIERTIVLVEKMMKKITKKIKLMISGKPEENEIKYFDNIIKLVREKEIDLILSKNEHKNIEKFIREDLFKEFDIFDIYRACDLVTLPSDIEGFGNPVIESSVFRKPLFVNNYPVLRDMLSKGFEFIVIDKKVNAGSVDKTIEILEDWQLRERITEKNFQIAKKFYSMDYLVSRLDELVKEFES